MMPGPEEADRRGLRQRSGRMVRARDQRAGFTYTNGLIHSQTLNARGLPQRIRDRTSAGASRLDYSYTYDAHGHRTLSTRNTGSTRHQIYTRAGQLLYTEDSRDNQRIDYIHLDGKLVAQRSRPLNTSTATLTWHHTDAIQSANVETSSAGAQTHRTVRMPFGAPYSGQYREGPGFAGHVTDTQTNLTYMQQRYYTYMQQRYYDPIAQRFLSPDPVDVSTANGSNFNRYWYANNNPYKFVDPDGRWAQVFWGAPIGFVVEIAAQKISNPDEPINWKSVGVSTVTGGVTGGVASVARVAAVRGTLTVGQAVAATTATNTVVGAASSAADSMVNGESPEAGKMAIAAGANGILSAVAGLGGAKGVLAEKMSAASPSTPQGIGGHIISASQTAGNVGSTAAVQGAASMGGRVADIARETTVSTTQIKAEEKIK